MKTDTETQNKPDNAFAWQHQKTTYVIYVPVPNTKNTETLCNNNTQILMKLAHEIKQQWNMEQVTIAPTVLSATDLVKACITVSNKGLVPQQKSI